MKYDLKDIDYLELNGSCKSNWIFKPISEKFIENQINTTGSSKYAINITLKLKVIERKVLKSGKQKVKLSIESIWVPTVGAFPEVYDAKEIWMPEKFDMNRLFKIAYFAYNEKIYGEEYTRIILPNFSKTYYLNFLEGTLQLVTQFTKLVEKTMVYKINAISKLSTSYQLQEDKFQKDITLQNRKFAFDNYQNKLKMENDENCAIIGSGDGGVGYMIATAIAAPGKARSILSNY